MELIYTDTKDKAFKELCKQLDQYLNNTNGEQQNTIYDQYNHTDDLHCVVLVYDNETPIACVGIKVYVPLADEKDLMNSVEIKRMFVQPNYRGQGLAKAMIEALEVKAKADGFTRMILETGIKMNSAIGLYTSCGYQKINNYGSYKELSDSVCMSKNL
jgi:GNAT superfamily N-acetyltransferase